MVKKQQSVKYKKAPQAPRRFKSAYMFFSTEKHKEIRKDLTDKNEKMPTTQVAKLVSQAWKDLTAEERDEWEEMARRDKARYEVEKSMYNGPWKIPAKKRCQKDPSAPKRPMSAFLSFSNSKRSLIRKQHPDIGNAQVSRILAQMWKDAPEDERQQHIEKEYQLRQDYKVAIADWKKKHNSEQVAMREQREQIALQHVVEAKLHGSNHNPAMSSSSSSMLQSSDRGGLADEALDGTTSEGAYGDEYGGPNSAYMGGPNGGNHNVAAAASGAYSSPSLAAFAAAAGGGGGGGPSSSSSSFGPPPYPYSLGSSAYGGSAAAAAAAAAAYDDLAAATSVYNAAAAGLYSNVMTASSSNPFHPHSHQGGYGATTASSLAAYGAGPSLADSAAAAAAAYGMPPSSYYGSSAGTTSNSAAAAAAAAAAGYYMDEPSPWGYHHPHHPHHASSSGPHHHHNHHHHHPALATSGPPYAAAYGA